MENGSVVDEKSGELVDDKMRNCEMVDARSEIE
jgi:hypothetical protein